MTATEVEPDQTATDDGDDDHLDHLWCRCKGPDIALCGSDLTGVVEATALDQLTDLCVVCKEIAHSQMCPCMTGKHWSEDTENSEAWRES